MKNHFIFAYSGNKRDEVEIIYKELNENKLLNDDITTIIEPFAGTSAISYYISLQHPLKYKYIINDNNELLIELYKIFSDNEKIKQFITTINEMCFIDNVFIDKTQYNNIKKLKNIYSYFIKNNYYNIHPGLYPIGKKKNLLNIETVLAIPIINFLQTENIEFYNKDALELILENNNKYTLNILDPPYIFTDNSTYKKPTFDIYKWYFENKQPPTEGGHTLLNFCFILEYIYVIELIFQNDTIILYDKKYTGNCKRKVKHAFICKKSN